MKYKIYLYKIKYIFDIDCRREQFLQYLWSLVFRVSSVTFYDMSHPPFKTNKCPINCQHFTPSWRHEGESFLSPFM